MEPAQSEGQGDGIERQRRNWTVCLWFSQLDGAQHWLREVPHSASKVGVATEDGDGTAGRACVWVYQE